MPCCKEHVCAALSAGACTAGRRYGVLWAYDHESKGITVEGEPRADARGDSLGFHFCPNCGCVASWRSLEVNEAWRRCIAVNLRLTVQPGGLSPTSRSTISTAGQLDGPPA